LCRGRERGECISDGGGIWVIFFQVKGREGKGGKGIVGKKGGRGWVLKQNKSRSRNRESEKQKILYYTTRGLCFLPACLPVVLSASLARMKKKAHESKQYNFPSFQGL
jgi:hypothetical protein